MKTLYLVRHAKSSWEDSQLRDYDRPLNKRGKKDAPNMGRRLALMRVSVDLLLSSPANRAYTTATIIASAFNYDKKAIETDEAIYHASRTELVEILKAQDQKLNAIMFFGHNPGFTDLANYLTGADIDNIPTCGVAAIQLEISAWKSLNRNTGKLLFFEYPKKEFEGKFLS